MYFSLQICRGLAALMVVCFHVGVTLNRDIYLGPAADVVRRLSSFGDAGVAFFFVLSGFIVTWVHQSDFNHPERLGAYLLKRMTRIYPMYWLAFAMTCLFVWLFPTSRTTLPSDPLVLIKALWLIPQDPAVVGGTGAPVVFVAWTLQYEMAFYGVLALALLNRWLLLLPIGLFLLNRLTFSADDGFIRAFFYNEHLFLFGMGAGLAVLNRRPWRLSGAQARLLLAGTSLALMALVVWEDLTFPATDRSHRVLLWGSVSTMGILALIHLEDAGWRPDSSSLLVRIGHASYVLYLIHVAIMTVLSKLVTALAQLAGPAVLASPAAAIVAAALIVSVCAMASLQVHQHIERPLMLWLNGLTARWTGRTKTLPPPASLV